MVAVPRQRGPLRLRDRDADVVFVRRDVTNLAAELVGTDLGPVLVTTPEQTVLDLAHRPTLGAPESVTPDAARALLPRCDPGELDRIAAESSVWGRPVGASAPGSASVLEPDEVAQVAEALAVSTPSVAHGATVGL